MQLNRVSSAFKLGPSGFTLPELLVASTVGLIALSGFLAFNRYQLFSLRNQANQLDVQTTARNVVDLFAREVRRAGMNPGCAIAGFSGIADAKSTSVRIQADLDGDGTTNGINEDLTYRYDPSTNTVERVDQNGTTDTLIANVDLSGSTIRYFDGNGVELIPSSSSGLTAAQRSSVRRIRIQLSVAEPAVDPTNTMPLRAQVATDVDLRNRYFVNATACP